MVLRAGWQHTTDFSLLLVMSSWQACQQDSLFPSNLFLQDSFVCPQETPAALTALSTWALIVQAEESEKSSASALHPDQKAERGGREIFLLFGKRSKIYFF